MPVDFGKRKYDQTNQLINQWDSHWIKRSSINQSNDRWGSELHQVPGNSSHSSLQYDESWHIFLILLCIFSCSWWQFSWTTKRTWLRSVTRSRRISAGTRHRPIPSQHQWPRRRRRNKKSRRIKNKSHQVRNHTTNSQKGRAAASTLHRHRPAAGWWPVHWLAHWPSPKELTYRYTLRIFWRISLEFSGKYRFSFCWLEKMAW